MNIKWSQASEIWLLPTFHRYSRMEVTWPPGETPWRADSNFWLFVFVYLWSFLFICLFLSLEKFVYLFIYSVRKFGQCTYEKKGRGHRSYYKLNSKEEMKARWLSDLLILGLFKSQVSFHCSAGEHWVSCQNICIDKNENNFLDPKGKLECLT